MQKSQNDTIQEYLEAGHSITPLEALNKFNCLRLGARVADLKKRGLDIVTKIIKDSDTSKRYASYFLRREAAHA